MLFSCSHSDFTCEHELVQNLAIPSPCFHRKRMKSEVQIPKWPRLASSELPKETEMVIDLKTQINLSGQLICLFLGELYSSESCEAAVLKIVVCIKKQPRAQDSFVEHYNHQQEQDQLALQSHCS